jgi:hypothetical protein
MTIRALIAFGSRPRDPSTFLNAFRAVAKADGVEIAGAVLCPGPGCSNLAFIAETDDIRFVEQLTMALMPAKYELTSDPRLVVGEFVTEDFA